MPSTASSTIVLKNVSVCYRRFGQFLFSKRKSDRVTKEFWALKNVNFIAYEGDNVGIIGRNGAGKSTCAKIISGSIKPDSGEIQVAGSSHLLALGVGFKITLTGRENVKLSASIMGMSRKAISENMESIETFADIGDFFDEPLSIYSSGMKSRLGFAVSTAIKPDILILDEVMSTGDASFRQKASERLQEMKDTTKTIVLVSHSASQIKKQCNKIVWLEKGEIILSGETNEVLPRYEAFSKNPDQWLEDHSQL